MKWKFQPIILPWFLHTQISQSMLSGQSIQSVHVYTTVDRWVGGKIENKINMKIYNAIIVQNGDTAMHFLDQNLRNGEQLKHRNIKNEILWIYGIFIYIYI